MRSPEFDVERLDAVCRRYGVAALSVFGSVARGDDGVASDIDLLYDLHPDARLGWEADAAAPAEPESGPTRVLPVGPLVEEVQRLKDAPGRDIVATGSTRLVHALVAAGLVDEFRLLSSNRLRVGIARDSCPTISSSSWAKQSRPRG